MDGIFAVQQQDESWVLHVIECKRTIKESKWRKVKYQFEASILRAVGLLESLGIQVKSIKLYTAVQNDLLSLKIQSDPNLDRMTIEEWKSLPIDDQEMIHYLDWNHPGLELWIRSDLPHEIVQLDEEGRAEVRLEC